MIHLDNILDIAPAENPPVVLEAEIPVVKTDKDAENDFKYARENLYNAISVGEEALSEMLEVAKQSQHPRAYEVLSTLINTVAAVNKDLLDIQKKKKDFFAEKEKTEQNNITNNLFVGSTAELQKFLQNRKKDG